MCSGEEHRVTVFGNGAPRLGFGSTRRVITGEWRKLHSEKLHNLQAAPDIVRVIILRRIR
jgi:hypothetical protein